MCGLDGCSALWWSTYIGLDFLFSRSDNPAGGDDVTVYLSGPDAGHSSELPHLASVFNRGCQFIYTCVAVAISYSHRRQLAFLARRSRGVMLVLVLGVPLCVIAVVSQFVSKEICRHVAGFWCLTPSPNCRLVF